VAGHRWTTHLHLILKLRNYMSHPTICCHVVDTDSITTLSSLSLQFFMLVSGRIPQLHILAKLFHMILLLKRLLLSKVIKKNCVKCSDSVMKGLTCVSVFYLFPRHSRAILTLTFYQVTCELSGFLCTYLEFHSVFLERYFSEWCKRNIEI
jgi:hypothetical protein